MALGRSTSLVADAGAAGSLFGSAIMNTLGFEDEEAAVNRILKNADFNTAEGMEKLKSDVRAISMDAYEELMLQLNTTAQAEAQTQNTKLATENSIIQNKVKLNRGIYSREFERDASSSGMEFAIRQYFSNEGLEYDENNPPKTIAQASTLIAKLRKKEKDGRTYITGVKNAVGTALENYVNMRAIQDSGLQGSSNESKVAATTNAFDTPSGDGNVTDESNTLVEETEGFDDNASNWDSFWNGVNVQSDLKQQLNSVQVSMTGPFKPEMFMKQDELKLENQEDTLQQWLGSGEAFTWFLGKNPAEVQKFIANPQQYFQSNIKTIVSNSSFEADDMQDIFDF